ncbi:MAG: hypothetical protein NC311_19705 [Muribaculaceae bacterium]|nr:hypothetical protein [Muribaculaceae bacterium]
MQLTLTNDRLRELIPNVIHEVKGETPLLTKMLPWLDTAKGWTEDNFLGPEFEPAGAIVPIVERIMVYKAFSMAVPSLDLSLSPSGFTVINTDGRAPASKERVERLTASLSSVVDANADLLVTALYGYEEWRGSEMGRWWLATFLPNLNEVFRFRGRGDLLTTYRSMRSLAQRFEQEVEEQYLGSTLGALREGQCLLSDKQELVSMVREAELRYIGFHMRDQKAICPDEHEVWHLIRPVMVRLKYYPDLYRTWDAEMGEKFRPEPFKNDIKGGFYF